MWWPSVFPSRFAKLHMGQLRRQDLLSLDATGFLQLPHTMLDSDLWSDRAE